MMDELFTVLAGGADAVIIGVGVMLIRMERRLARLEFKVFGFDLGSRRSGSGEL